MKRAIIFLALAILVIQGFGQQTFSSVYESLKTNDRFSNMLNLRAYQSQNPEHSIAMYLLGEIYFDYIRETDPLNHFYAIESDYRQAQTYLQLAQYRFDERQARNDREYYGEIKLLSGKKKATVDDIKAFMQERIDSLDSYYEATFLVHSNYVKCANKYNESLFSYRDLLRFFPNQKDLYLHTTPIIRAQVEKIGADFDSARVYFEEYRKVCASLPHLLKVSDLSLKPIETYRLEGLSEADFDKQEVEMWDFKSWSEQFLKIMDTDINRIRVELASIDKKIDDQLVEIENSTTYADEQEPFLPDEVFQNLIGKYDYTSLANRLLDYKRAKTLTWAKTRQTINDPNNADEYLINRLRFYRDLANDVESLNKDVEQLKKSSDLDGVGKYLDFFESNYQGLVGLMRWCEVEKFENRSFFNKNLDHLDRFLAMDEFRNSCPDSSLLYKKKRISLEIQQAPVDSIALSDTVFTFFVEPFGKKETFLAGLDVDAKGERRPFVAKIDRLGNVLWFSTVRNPIKNIKSTLMPFRFQTLSDGSSVLCCSCINVEEQGSKGSSMVWLFDGTGKSKLFDDQNVSYEYMPRYFEYDEVNESFLLVTQGNELLVDKSEQMDLDFILFSKVNGLKRERFNIHGQFVDVINTNGNYFAVCNATLLNGENSKFESAWGMYVNSELKVDHVINYGLPQNLCIERAEKVTSNVMNLFGKIDSADDTDHSWIYMLTDSDGNLQFSNQPKIEQRKY